MTRKRALDSPPTRQHYRRAALLAGAVVAAALGIGVLGYCFLNDESWVDAFVDAAMILGGMGPVTALKHDGAKIFAGAYALFSGLVFIGSAALILSPWLHQLMHRLHAQPDDDS